MSTETCDVVAERVALGQELAELGEHAASCERCRALVALPAELGVVHDAQDPGVGFTARMTLGAQRVLVARRRRRIAIGVASATAAAAAAVLVVTHVPETASPPATAPATANKDHNPPVPDDPGPLANDDLKALVKLARTDHASHVSARWSRITKPLAPYRALVKGVEP